MVLGRFKSVIENLVDAEYSMLETVSELFEIMPFDVVAPTKEELKKFLKENLTSDHLWFMENELFEYKILLAPITTPQRYMEAFNNPDVFINVMNSMDVLISSEAEATMRKQMTKTYYTKKNMIVGWEVTILGLERMPSAPSWDYEKFSLKERIQMFNERYPKEMGVSGMTYFGYLTMLLDFIHIDNTVPDFKFDNKYNICTGTILNGSIKGKSPDNIPVAEANDQGTKPLYWLAPRDKEYIGKHLQFRPCVRLQYT